MTHIMTVGELKDKLTQASMGDDTALVRVHVDDTTADGNLPITNVKINDHSECKRFIELSL